MRALLLALTILTTALATASPFPTFLQNTTLLLHTRATTDLQTFTGALASIAASPITNSGNPERPFSVAGNLFPDFASAGQRSCDVQFQGCQGAANNAPAAGKGKKAKVKRQGVTVEACSAQKDQCNKAQQSAKVKDFTSQAQAPAQSQGATVNIGPDPLFPDFDLICDA